MTVIQNLTVECDLSSLERARSGAIWGNIWLKGGVMEFPERRWNDMAVPALIGLAVATSSLREVGDDSEFRFFDGPFTVGLSLGQTNVVAVDLKERGKTTGLCQVNYEQWVVSLVQCSKAVVSECLNRKWSDVSDVRELDRVIAIVGH